MLANSLFQECYTDQFLVSTKYSNRIMWSICDKRKIIESIVRGIPIPSLYTVNGVLIDGLERVDAIYSFIKGEFGVFWEGKEHFFDVSALGIPELIAVLPQRKPVLDFDSSELIANYDVSITDIDQDVADEAYARIASHSVIDNFTNSHFRAMIRKAASILREDDVGKTIVPFSALHSKSHTTNSNLIWIRLDLMSMNDLRAGKDEELLAIIFDFVLRGYPSCVLGLNNLFNRSVRFEEREYRLAHEDYYSYVLTVVRAVQNLRMLCCGETFQNYVGMSGGYAEVERAFIVCIETLISLEQDGFCIDDARGIDVNYFFSNNLKYLTVPNDNNFYYLISGLRGIFTHYDRRGFDSNSENSINEIVIYEPMTDNGGINQGLHNLIRLARNNKNRMCKIIFGVNSDGSYFGLFPAGVENKESYLDHLRYQVISECRILDPRFVTGIVNSMIVGGTCDAPVLSLSCIIHT